MRAILAGLSFLMLCSCTSSNPSRSMDPEFPSDLRPTRHAGNDDLLSAGLGLAGLRGSAPAFADPENPTPNELRRRAIWTNWRGIVDLTPTGGFGALYGSVAKVDGREYAHRARLPANGAAHRVLAQVPDAFDRQARCLVVAPVSGSRGIYGTIGYAGSWGLPRGCAVVYTDKGLGTDLYDVDSASATALDGTRHVDGERVFMPSASDSAPAHRVAFRHAHSGANPEADWGRHTLQAMRFGLHALGLAFPELAPFTPANTRIIVTGLSNGGGAVLRAAELPGAEDFDAVVAIAPNVTPPGGRHLFDFALDAALYQPCLFADPDFEAAPGVLPPEVRKAAALARCASLAAAGLLPAGDVVEQARAARKVLAAAGWEDAPLRLAAFHVDLDLWRSLMATYAQAYTRATLAAPVCGYSFAAVDAQGQPRATSVAERATWWSDGSGIAPGMGVVVLDALAQGADRAFPALDCVRRLRAGEGAQAKALAEGIAQTLATAKPRSPRVLVVHGAEDGLVPVAFSSRPWVAAVREGGYGGALRYWEIPHAQHFDAFLALPSFAGRMLPLLPYAHQALDMAWAAVVEGASLPPEAAVQNHVPAIGTALSADDLGQL
jgi:hydroxybutyrate-dimer hydrolase